MLKNKAKASPTITLSILLTKIKLKEISPDGRQMLLAKLKQEISDLLSFRDDCIEIRLFDGGIQGNDTITVFAGFSGVKDPTAIYGHETELQRLLCSLLAACHKSASCPVRLTPDTIKIVVDDRFLEKLKGGTVEKCKNTESAEEYDYQNLARRFSVESPKFSFERLVLTKKVRQKIEESLVICQNRDKLFHTWGLSAIMSPTVVLNFYGDSGTGKTMAADAIADYLSKKIIRATYADIESKYHGEGPKMLKAIFYAASSQGAVLFIDEADSMLSARLSNVSSGSEQAINSMRSQLLICLEDFDGIVIFATNKIENYDEAFLTRLTCIEIERPNAELRREIWNNHIYPVGSGPEQLKIPLDNDIDLNFLAQSFDFCGRDIRNAVKVACTHAIVAAKEIVSQADFIYACERIQDELCEAALRARRNEIKAQRLSPEEEERQLKKIAEYYKKKFSALPSQNWEEQSLTQPQAKTGTERESPALLQS